MIEEKKLEILLLGTPAVYFSGESIQIKRRILRSLVFFLAYNHRLVSRNRLILLFWPDASEEDGRRHLREVLSKLRSQLPDPDILITDQDRVGLDFSKCRVDALEFNDLVSKTKLALQLTADPLLPATLFQDVLRAVQLWRSAHFMAGVNLPESDEYEKWILDTRREMENLRQYMVIKTAEHYIASNDLIEALRWLRAAVQTYELDIDLHLHIMEVLLRLGQTHEALDHYAHLTDLYQREGMGELPPAALQFYEKLTKGTGQATPARSIQWPSTLDLRVAFTGRKDILHTLTASFHNGGAVVVYGEPGAGKSRLLFELYRSLEPLPRLLLASGRLMETTIPFQPWIDLFRQSMTEQDWKKVNPTWLQALSVLLPELQQMDNRTPHKKVSLADQGRSYFFEAIHQVMLYLARRDRIFLCFDDAQWCDEATFTALSYLQSREFFEQHGFLIIGCRLGDATSAMDEFLKNRARHSNTKVINLLPLSGEDIRNICRSILGFVPGDEFVARIAANTGGNPLFLLETLRGMLQISLDKIQLEKITNFPTPSSIQSLIHNRFMSLSVDTRQVLVTAAIIGDVINTNDIAKASYLKLETVVNALEELEALHLIQPVSGAMTGVDYLFIHEKIREVLVKELSPARRKLLHLNAARVLEERYSGQRQYAVILANHFQEAGEVVKACHFWVQAGIHADHLLSPAQAQSAYHNAEQILDQNENLIPDDLVYQLFTSMMINYYESSNLQMLQPYAQKMLKLGRKRGSPLLIGTALSNLGSAESLLLNPLKGMVYLTEALPYINQTNNLKEKAEVNNRLGLLYQLALQFNLAVKHYQNSLKIVEFATEHDLVESRINANMQLGLLNYFLALPKKVNQHADLVLQDCQTIGNLPSAGKAYFLKCYASLAQEKYEDSISLAKSGLEIMQALNSRQFIGYTHLALADAYFKSGEIDESWRNYQLVLNSIKPGEYDDVLAEAYTNLGSVYLNMYAYEAARRILQTGLERYSHLTQKYSLQVRMAHAQAGLGHLDTALKLVNVTVQETEKLSLYLALIPARLCRGLLYSLLQDYKSAKTDLEWVRSEANKRSMLTYWGFACDFLGDLALRQNQPEEAHEYASKFSHRVSKVHNPWLEIACLRLKNRATRMMEETDFSIQIRIRELLDGLTAKCTISDLSTHLASYRTQILSEL
jgi:predicted ATPase/DNA-binding SARP family transcriptional activator